VDKRALLSLFRLAVVVVLLSGFVFGTAQLLPSIPAARTAAQQSDQEDLGAAVDRMVTGQQQAADAYARTGSAAQRRLDQVQAVWERATSTVRTLNWLERVTLVLTLFVTLWVLRVLPVWLRILRRRLLATSFGSGTE
jgi:hypothetical protein